jgi:hypothetical protein
VAKLETPVQEEAVNKGGTASKQISFKALSSDGQITLEWAAADHPTGRFNILRSETEEGEYLQINGAILSAPDELAEGVKYTYADTQVAPGTTYYYKLERLTAERKSIFIGPIPATPRLTLSQSKPEQEENK